jgi:hypothetical protein
MSRFCQPEQLDQFQQAGWQQSEQNEAREEIIRLKPPVKTKATVRAVEEANANKGDE